MARTGHERWRTVVTVVVLLLLEAFLIIGAVALFKDNPGAVSGASAAGTRKGWDVAPEIIEIPVLNGNLYNERSGIAYVYSTEVFAHVKGRNADVVRRHVSQFRQEIRSEIAALWREAEPRHLKEPRLETLTRLVHAHLDRRLGVDPADSDPLILKTIVVQGTGFRVLE